MKIDKKKVLDENGKLITTNQWLIEVDSTNIKELESLSNTIKSQLGQLRSEYQGTKKDNNRKRFESCLEIYKTDISHLYKDLVLDPTPKYYVYAHCEPNKIAIGKDGTTTWFATLGCELMPFYIGKGTGDRAYDINRNETHRKIKQKLQSFDRNIEVKIIKDGLTELEALCLESKLIDILGIIGKTGRLVNLDEGVKSKERQEIYSEALMKLNDFYFNYFSNQKTISHPRKKI